MGGEEVILADIAVCLDLTTAFSGANPPRPRGVAGQGFGGLSGAFPDCMHLPGSHGRVRTQIELITKQNYTYNHFTPPHCNQAYYNITGPHQTKLRTSRKK